MNDTNGLHEHRLVIRSGDLAKVYGEQAEEADVNEVEELARWIHRTFCRLRGKVTNKKLRLRHWSRLCESDRDDYRAVAERLLNDPPACLLSHPFVLEEKSQ